MSFYMKNAITSLSIVLRYGLSIILIAVCVLSAAEQKKDSSPERNFRAPLSLGKVGDNPYPTNPVNDRAKGYLLKGKVKSAVFNYGNIIQWGDYSSSTGYNGHPCGMWGNYSYLPHVSFMSGVPGQTYSHKFHWYTISTFENNSGNEVVIWGSDEAYEAWFADGDTVYVGVVFERKDDRGTVGTNRSTLAQIDGGNQWCIDESISPARIVIAVENTPLVTVNPNKSNSLIGLIYPWALRPKFKSRTDDFDLYDYGDDQEEWTEDDNYVFYGANVTESWFTRVSPSVNTEWHAANKARLYTHNTEYDAGELFGDVEYVDEDDTYPLLAHSNYSQTWPTEYNEDTGEYEPFWPGWYAQDYNIDLPGCSQSRKDDDCWEEVDGRFVSDTDVYMEFDDRWAHRSNLVNTNDEYEQTGYPTGLRVRATAHSYGVAYAEDILFVTVKVRNESGDWRDEDGVLHEAMIMPDGTQLNHGKGFDYKDMFLGFYMDADVVSMDRNGNTGVHTNDDDFMEYYWERFEINDESMLISMAMIYDYDGVSNSAADIGIVATQLLDSPRATGPVDLDLDGIADIYEGEPLKMTDWHWFDWYNRPGVVSRESGTNCCAGETGRAQARNKEEIALKVMSGDTVNLNADEKSWFFHTPHPDTDLDIELNPHFDSLEGLMEEDAFKENEEGLDCTLIMSCGPFDFAVGEEVPFSFCIIFGENKEDLIQNARFAQIMYNSHYQGYTPPSIPNVSAQLDHNQVKIMWTDVAERSKDVVTGYADFEGYKIYKSINGGETWGGPEDMIYDDSGIFVGWRPIAQFDLSAEEDSLHGVFNYGINYSENRGHEISGPDPLAPWYNLGTNSSLPDKNTDGLYEWFDSDVMDGVEYTYSVTSYDMGVEPPQRVVYTLDSTDASGNNYYVADTVYSTSNPNAWSDPEGYASIECSRGTTTQDANFVTVVPGYKAAQSLDSVVVVPNPFIVHSGYNESGYVRKLLFMNLPTGSKVTIFTVTGEKVYSFVHDDTETGNAFWSLRTVNNQEVAPGLYIYVVEYDGDKHIGKFAVVR